MKWLYPGIGIKRWIFIVLVGIFFAGFGFSMMGESLIVNNLAYYIDKVARLTVSERSLIIGTILVLAGFTVVLFGSNQLFKVYMKAAFPERMKDGIGPIYQQQMLKQGPKIVVVGGGTGLSVLLRGLKHYSSNITAVVAVGDDGGSSGRLREEFGIPPVGDLRNCIVALADKEDLMEQLFSHRFSQGGELEGHSLGNLLLVAMSQIKGNLDTAVSDVNEILYIRGKVIPATSEPLTLQARLEDGQVIQGESNISKTDKRIKRLSIIPKDAEPAAEAIKAIQEADAIILGPGSLYTSIIPNLLIDGLVEEIAKSPAAKMYICNVMTQPGETGGYTAGEHLEALYQHSRKGMVDYIILNNKKIEDDEVLEHYLDEGAEPVIIDRGFLEHLGVKVVAADVLNETELVRHHSDRLAKVVLRTILMDKRYRRKYGVMKQMMNLKKIREK